MLKTQASGTSDSDDVAADVGAQIQKPHSPLPAAQEPGPSDARHWLVPNYRDASSVDQKIGGPSGEVAASLCQSDLCLCPIDQRADPIQPEHIEARNVFNKPLRGEVWG